MREINYNIKNYYSCQRCQKEIEYTEELKIIVKKFPLCINCKKNISKKKQSIFEFQFEEKNIILDEETKDFLESIMDKGMPLIKNGYLVIEKEGGTIYFHRFIFEDELKILGSEFQIHHINENKLDNRKENLQILRKDEHYALHEHKRYERAYHTWVEKVYGYEEDLEEHYQEFDEWLKSKGDIW
jgi:hypothetical protein